MIKRLLIPIEKRSNVTTHFERLHDIYARPLRIGLLDRVQLGYIEDGIFTYDAAPSKLSNQALEFLADALVVDSTFRRAVMCAEQGAAAELEKFGKCAHTDNLLNVLSRVESREQLAKKIALSRLIECDNLGNPLDKAQQTL